MILCLFTPPVHGLGEGHPGQARLPHQIRLPSDSRWRPQGTEGKPCRGCRPRLCPAPAWGDRGARGENLRRPAAADATCGTRGDLRQLTRLSRTCGALRHTRRRAAADAPVANLRRPAAAAATCGARGENLQHPAEANASCGPRGDRRHPRRFAAADASVAIPRRPVAPAATCGARGENLRHPAAPCGSRRDLRRPRRPAAPAATCGTRGDLRQLTHLPRTRGTRGDLRRQTRLLRIWHMCGKQRYLGQPDAPAATNAPAAVSETCGNQTHLRHPLN